MVFRQIREKTAAPKLVLIGNFGAGNIGDELILAGFLQKIGKELPRAQVVVLASEPKLVRRFHGVDSLPQIPTGLRSFWKLNWLRSLKRIKEADAIIFPGGGLFNDQESPRSVWIWGWPILITRYFWKPVFLLGQSVGPFEKNWTQKFTKFCLGKTEWIGTRDNARLKKLGLPAKKIKSGKDSAFWLSNRLPKTREIKKRGVLKVLISVRDFPKIEPQFWDELAQALDKLAEKKRVRISFAEFGRGDQEIWKMLCEKAQNSKIWKVLKLPESAEEILKDVKKFDLVIGMRLHSLITAKLTGVSAIGLAYAKKVSDLAEKSIPIADFKKEKLGSLITQIK